MAPCTCLWRDPAGNVNKMAALETMEIKEDCPRAALALSAHSHFSFSQFIHLVPITVTKSVTPVFNISGC